MKQIILSAVSGINATVSDYLEMLFKDSKSTVSALATYNLKKHGSGTVDGIFVATGRTETTFVAKGIGLEFTTGTTTIHGITKRRITTIKHVANVFHDGYAGMCGIKDFLIMISDNSL